MCYNYIKKRKEVLEMMLSKNKTGVLVNMDRTLKAELEEQAKADGRSLTNYIINVLTKHMKEIREKQNK